MQLGLPFKSGKELPAHGLSLTLDYLRRSRQSTCKQFNSTMPTPGCTMVASMVSHLGPWLRQWHVVKSSIQVNYLGAPHAPAAWLHSLPTTQSGGPVLRLLSTYVLHLHSVQTPRWRSNIQWKRTAILVICLCGSACSCRVALLTLSHLQY